ncbi:NACHT domain-containing protein [Streptomyces sp. NPDC008313]|uniref:NACHT domain-containing protein n=1 Tax=Streptomyces sp. NPDC008313 TaxID=3364826 RepID=UPI0036F0173D
MDPAVLGTKLASSLIGPAVRKLFVREEPGAGLTDKPVRLTALVSFRGEKRTLDEKGVRRLAAHLVRQAAGSPGEPPFPADEETAVGEALARKLLALGDLDMDDVQAVRLGHRELARLLHTGAPTPAHLCADSSFFLDSATEWACVHILDFFTRRSTFVARTLVEQTRGQTELIAKVDELITRSPRPDARDAAFERRYLPYTAKKHGRLTIYGIDLTNSPGKWPLDVAYLSLEVTRARGPEPGDTGKPIGVEEVLAGLRRLTGYEDAYSARAPRPADQALADHDRILLRGVAGSGKTTLVQWLAVSATRAEPDGPMAYLHGRVPFVLPLRSLTRHGERLPGPGRFLDAAGCPLTGAQPEGWADRVLSAGRGLVLVDGIDEIPDDERNRARAWLGDLIGAYPGNRWLVTSRPSAVREGWLADEGFTELVLTAMSPSGVAAFIRRWHSAARTGDPEEETALAAYEEQLLEAVRGKADLGRLATNPLMCGLICALHRDRRGHLPHRRHELYEAGLAMLLTRRDRERDITAGRLAELDQGPQIQLLQRLAYWLIRNGRTELDRERAERIVGEALPSVPAAAALGDAATVFRHLLLRSGLLREPAPGTVDFVHRTFQDYLGARAAVEAWDIGLLIEHAADDQWEDVIRMAVAHARPRERADILTELISAGDRAARGPQRDRAFLLAAASLEHATELDPSVRAAVERRTGLLIPPRSASAARELATVGPLILDLLPAPLTLHPDMAESAVIAASNVASEAAIPYLARCALHPSLRVRAQLVWAWRRFDTDRYAREVIARVDPVGLYFTTSSPEQLRALLALGGRPWVDLRGDMPPELLTEYAVRATARPEALRVRGAERLSDLAFLTGLTQLQSLIVSRCPELTDLSALRGHALRSVTLAGLSPSANLEFLTSLNELAELTLLPHKDAEWTLDVLPPRAPLTVLDLFGGPGPGPRGLRGISRWPRLASLALGEHSSPRSAAEWSEIARLPALTSLRVSSSALSSCPESVTLSSVEDLSLSVEDPVDLGRVVRMFPRVTTLFVDGDTAYEHLDLSPLADLPNLRKVVYTPRILPAQGAGRLPGHVRVVESHDAT